MSNLKQWLVNTAASKPVRKVADLIASPLTLAGAAWFRYFRSRDVNEMPVTKSLLNRLGVFPINDHYYEPLFNMSKHLTKSVSDDRNLPGINFNDQKQLDLLGKFQYNEELLRFPLNSNKGLTYYYYNGSYPAGDAELLYNMIRYYKPAKLIEIGCGFSTLMIQNAIEKNKLEEKPCEHICIEPYEMKWLENLDIQIIRKKVEDIEIGFFQTLGENDVLFIDSSHMIRPQGDVLFEFLEILPLLPKGVIVHVHDIYTPKDYPERWLKDLNRFWNEQYLLEAFLTLNTDYEILLAANYARHHYEEALLTVCPVLSKQPTKEPGSFWLQRL